MRHFTASWGGLARTRRGASLQDGKFGNIGSYGRIGDCGRVRDFGEYLVELEGICGNIVVNL